MSAKYPWTILCVMLLAFCRPTSAEVSASRPVDPEQPVRCLLLDSRIVQDAQNARLVLGTVTKEPANPLLAEERPWEPRFDNLYPNVIYDEQERLYKCWYSPFIIDEAVTRTPPEQRKTLPYLEALTGNNRYAGVCYAVSRDGIAWDRPNLGIVEFNGAKENNIVVRGVHGAGIFKDPRDPDPGRRYKLFGKTGEDREPMGVAFSADGIHWSAPVGCPRIGAAGDTHNNAFWDERLGAYVGITRLWDGQRIVGRTVSNDFVAWSRAEPVLAGTPERQTYAMPVFRCAGVYLGLVMILDTRSDVVDCELTWSPDGVRFERVCEGQSFIPRGPAGSFDDGCVYAAACPIVRESEVRIYYAGSDDTHASWRKGGLGLARLRTDRYAGFEPAEPTRPAVVTTVAVPAIGTSLVINADAAGGSLVVEMLGDNDRVLATSRPLTTDAPRAPVAWSDPEALRELGGRPVCLRFQLQAARLYAFHFE